MEDLQDCESAMGIWPSVRQTSMVNRGCCGPEDIASVIKSWKGLPTKSLCLREKHIAHVKGSHKRISCLNMISYVASVLLSALVLNTWGMLFLKWLQQRSKASRNGKGALSWSPLPLQSTTFQRLIGMCLGCLWPHCFWFMVSGQGLAFCISSKCPVLLLLASESHWKQGLRELVTIGLWVVLQQE